MLAALIATSLTRTSGACTTFCLIADGRPVFAKNYDWRVEEGVVHVNQRGVERTALVPGGDGQPARWVSRYGSVTFNQYGRDQPSGGINEKGLVIELMWLDGTTYPAADTRPVVGVLEWIQYQLDRSATVTEVLASDRVIRIGGRTPLHWLVADRSGDAATIEFLDGRLVTHTGDSLRVAALTNHAYRDSLAYLRTVELDGRDAAGDGSLARFARAARRLRSFAGGADQAVASAFRTLDQVAQPSTVWSIVYEVTAGRVHFRTRARRAIRTIDLGKLEFDCGRARAGHCEPAER